MPNIILSDGFEITIPVDYQSQKCIMCDELVISPSMGGPLICPSCDCGFNRNGEKWNFADFAKKAGPNSKASKRQAEIQKRRKEIQAAVMVSNVVEFIKQA